MNLSDKCKEHVDSCRFCWMCHHICPIGNATGHERNTARARALGISLVNREAIKLEEIIDNIYECATCGACVHDCVTGWDPVLFTKEVRLEAALEGALPEYISRLVDNCLDTGNAYGKKDVCECLLNAIRRHKEKTPTLLYLGTDTRYMAPEQGVKAIEALEKAGVNFTLLEGEAASGAELDFLIGAAEEAKEQMTKAAEQMSEFDTVIVLEPSDAKVIKRTYKEYGIEVSAKVYTFTAFLAELCDSGKIAKCDSGLTVVFQDPYQLSRDLQETEEARRVISAFATLHEMHLNRAETVFAGNILMAEYCPEVIKQVAKRRISNAKSLGESIIVTASAAEYTALKRAGDEGVRIISLQELILL